MEGSVLGFVFRGEEGRLKCLALAKPSSGIFAPGFVNFLYVFALKHLKVGSRV